MPNPTLITQGGTLLYVSYSGVVGGDTLIYSGAGRLNAIIPHQQTNSGIPVLFYDAPVATSGGIFAASGHHVVGILPGISPGAQSGDLTLALPIAVNFPFRSGLCHTSRSGQVGFTAVYNPETNTN